ncbi:MAG: cytochrome b/b6 domain-containing protein [Acetobacteraceae bacterium]|nr:cytochrome b/b6 domain-containing protein [Acetobacteraceae bacterium]MBV8589034.1 cytochrome b/b6 domain-containing protein [Acetobacteraceae bacterium]
MVTTIRDNKGALPIAKQAGATRPLIVRITHWVNAFAMTCMILSGWRIYNASPLFPFTFPPWATLGGWLAGALAWHFAAMWLLVANGLLYLAYGLFSGYLRRTLLPLTRDQLWQDFRAALTLRLKHRVGVYNTVQRLLYIVVLLLGPTAVLSGLAIWKPVQFSPLTTLLGGYDTARLVHFVAMAGITGFIVIHLTLVILVPRTLLSMITGGSRQNHATEARI